MVVCRIMIERAIIITDLHKVWKTLGMVREAIIFQEETVGRESGFYEEAVEY